MPIPRTDPYTYAYDTVGNLTNIAYPTGTASITNRYGRRAGLTIKQPSRGQFLILLYDEMTVDVAALARSGAYRYRSK